MAEADEEFWEQLLTSYYHSSDSLLENAWHDLEDGAVEQGWAAPTTITYNSQAKFAAVCQAVDELYYAVLGDTRHWVAQQVLTWALAQLADLEPSAAAPPASPLPEGSEVVVLDGAYNVVEPSNAASSDQLSFW